MAIKGTCHTDAVLKPATNSLIGLRPFSEGIMTIICPKCNYERNSNDLAPTYECPACGIVYFKYKAKVELQNYEYKKMRANKIAETAKAELYEKRKATKNTQHPIEIDKIFNEFYSKINANKKTLSFLAAFILFLVATPLNSIGNYFFNKNTKGSVFIKTNGGENIKLGLANIKIHPISKNEIDLIEIYIKHPKREYFNDLKRMSRTKYLSKYLSTYENDSNSMLNALAKKISLLLSDEEQDVNVLTNADGNFEFISRKGVSYLITGESDRKFFTEHEHYLWAVVIDQETANENLLLSNHNLYSSYSE